MSSRRDYFPYPGKFTFVDVEIPNLNNNCICAASIIVVEDHQVILRHTELINPMTYFSPNNIKIHHIRTRDVKNARTIRQFWKDFGQYFTEDYIIGAHNALSDISVLNKDLTRIRSSITSKYFIDTMDIMEKGYYQGSQQKGDLRLCNIAQRLDIELDHHNPESDANACFEIVKYMYEHFDMDLEPYIRKIPEMKISSSRPKTKPTSQQAKKTISSVLNKIASQDPSTSISAAIARKKGNRAFADLDYNGIIFNYEVAAARKSTDINLYLRLSSVYDSLGLPRDSIRVLRKGISNLKKANMNPEKIQKTLSRKIHELTRPSRKKKAPKPNPDKSHPAANG